MDLDEALEIEDALGLGRGRGGPGQEGQDRDGRKGQEKGGASYGVPSTFNGRRDILYAPSPNGEEGSR